MNGEYRNTIDEKGRLIIPPKLREKLGCLSELVLTKSLDKSLWLFPKAAFDELSAAVNYGPLSALDRNARIMNLAVIAPGRDVELDKTGRLAVPQVFREYAGLNEKSECMILGVGNRIEIMNPDVYENLMAEINGEKISTGDLFSHQRAEH